MLLFEAHGTGATIRNALNGEDLLSITDPVTSFEFFDINGDGYLDPIALNRNAVAPGLGVKVWNGQDVSKKHRLRTISILGVPGPVYAVAPIRSGRDLGYVVARENELLFLSDDLDDELKSPVVASVRRLARVAHSNGDYFGAIIACPSLLNPAAVCFATYRNSFGNAGNVTVVSTNPFIQRAFSVSGSVFRLAQTTGSLRIQTNLSSSGQLSIWSSTTVGASSIFAMDLDLDNIVDDITVRASNLRIAPSRTAVVEMPVENMISVFGFRNPYEQYGAFVEDDAGPVWTTNGHNVLFLVSMQKNRIIVGKKLKENGNYSDLSSQEFQLTGYSLEP